MCSFVRCCLSFRRSLSGGTFLLESSRNKHEKTRVHTRATLNSKHVQEGRGAQIQSMLACLHTRHNSSKEHCHHSSIDRVIGLRARERQRHSRVVITHHHHREAAIVDCWSLYKHESIVVILASRTTATRRQNRIPSIRSGPDQTRTKRPRIRRGASPTLSETSQGG